MSFETTHPQLRPLLGMTILVIDSRRTYSEVLRLACLRTGARIRRADSLVTARCHLRCYRPSRVLLAPKLLDCTSTQHDAFVQELIADALHVEVMHDQIESPRQVVALLGVEPGAVSTEKLLPDSGAVCDDLQQFAELRAVDLPSGMATWIAWADDAIQRDFPEQYEEARTFLAIRNSLTSCS